MFTLKFKTDNAAFDGDTRREECAHILRRVAESLARGSDKGSCRDTNGNTVGEWKLTGGKR